MAIRNHQPWEIIDRNVRDEYKICRRIGRGSYGIVWEVQRHDDPDATYALKKVLYAFRDSTDSQRAYREISYLLEFGAHENILCVQDVMVSGDDRHMYIITDLLESDLQKAMRCQALLPIHKPLIAYQTLRALKYLHSAQVMHRDVKPSNILLDSYCQVVLCDFGWARSSPDSYEDDEFDDGAPTTDYAATRWYRAPEMLLGGRRYTTAVDMWAIACVVAEMHLEAPLLAGTSTIDMLAKIEELLGKPSNDDSEAMGTLYAVLAFEVSPAGPPNKPLKLYFAGEEDEELVDFLNLLLQYNPLKRMLADEAIKHPYVGQYHNPDDEPGFGRRSILPLPDSKKLLPARYRDRIYADYVSAGNDAVMYGRGDDSGSDEEETLELLNV